MAPVTEFQVKEKYDYLNGFGSYHSSEAVQGANPLVINSPQKPPYGLRTERISGTSFTAPREKNLQTWLYRVVASLERSEFQPIEDVPERPSRLSPNSYMWPTFTGEEGADWTKQKLIGRNGEPEKKEGLAIWLFAASRSMAPRMAFSSLDGEQLIIPQAGALDIQTEQGRLLVQQNEICVIPRGIRYTVSLPDGPARGYICELYEGHYELPDLGIIGSHGLANVRDFQIPTAHFSGSVKDNRAVVSDNEEWTIITRLSSRLWSCTQPSTPFDVVSWHGTLYPYKYDLARFAVLGNLLFDHHDPSLFVVLRAAAHGKAPGTSIVDFAIIPPRYGVAQDTLWLPYFHRNTMSEFYGPIINSHDPRHPLNKASKKSNAFAPFMAGLNGSNVPHGPAEAELQQASNEDLSPRKIQNDGVTIFLIETERTVLLSEWAEKSAVNSFGQNNLAKAQPKI
ncbi:hypothetical protein CKM354_001027100 [Cercospora kikuchii]|uniref:homogentisate 1,2-dioxygenase n=1 Tax=Cercospora kikuchii TaxID=84275 RepID=A0A9P3CPX0_9PEZI|nr:uncharacterized protein CKM354_001027100 [Cercospora kikuchii]GIZ47172.1 hypothetical protein CKM354_001027100 [Cercospora kikuchii]